MKAFLKEVAEDLNARLGKDLHHAAIIFNNKRPVAYLQHHLAAVIGKPFWSPSFYTIQEFFAMSSDLKVADSFTQFFTLYQQYNLLLKGEGGKEIPPDIFYPVARMILSDFAQIDNDLVPADRLFEELEDIAVIEKDFQHLSPEQQLFLEQFWTSYSTGKQKKHQEQFIKMWRRMPLLYRAFHEELELKGMSTMARMYRNLAEGSAGNSEFIKPFIKGKLVFAGFNALSKAEAVVFKRWNEAGLALFYFDTDSYYMDDEMQEAGLFLRKNIHHLGLPNALGVSRPHMRSMVKEIKVFRTQGHTAQAKLLQQELEVDYPVLDALDTTGKVAIVLADESLLLPVLQSVPSHYIYEGVKKELPLNVTMGYPLLASSVFGLADLWLSVQSAYSPGKKLTVNYRDAEAFLSHPLVGMDATHRNDVLSKMLLMQQTEIGPEVWKEAGVLAGMFFQPAQSGAMAIKGLQDIFRNVLSVQLDAGLLRQTEADLLIAVITELNKLFDSLKEYAATLPLNFVLSLMQKAVQGIAVPLSGEPLEGLQVMGLLESRSLDFEHLYILGASEGILPQVSVSPSFIPDSIRRAYGLPVIENQDAISAYMFYRLLHRAKTVSLVYNGQADDSTTGEPTRFLRQLEFESGYKFSYFEQSQPVSTADRKHLDIIKTPAIQAVLNSYLEERDSRPILSATALTTYLNCPVQFFYKYIAAIKEPEAIAEQMEANQVGSMLHHLLENFYSELKKSGPYITADRIIVQKESLAKLAKEAYAAVVFKDSPPPVFEPGGMQQVILAIVMEYARVILEYDERYAPFSLLALEDKVLLNFPLQVAGKQKSINLLGIVDRIDQKDGITRIVDYKTGRDELNFSSLDDLFDQESPKQNKALVQTLFYTYVYEKNKNITGLEPNLYLVRKMQKDGTLFYQMVNRKRLHLQTVELELQKQDFQEKLQNKLEEIFNPETPFIHTTQPENCQYCPYLSLCGK